MRLPTTQLGRINNLAAREWSELRIAVLNYGIGNLFSVTSALRKLGTEVRVVDELDWRSYDGIILPGVGSFEAGSKSLIERGLREQILDAIRHGVPLLGICLGMQLLFEESEEGPGEGLSVFPGKVVKLRVPGKVPHMGWNTIKIVRHALILEGIKSGDWVYFVHSYYPAPLDREIVLAETSYFVDFPAIIGRKNVYGTQFHPEKSGETGNKLLRNFIELCKR